MLAANAETLPHGHVLFEPTLFDSISYAAFDSRGVAHDVERAHNFGLQSDLNYGLTDRFMVGLIPRLAFTKEMSDEQSSAGVGLGDVTVQAQYRLNQFEEGYWLPTIAVNLQETLPTGSMID